ncbi:DUF397 domain-containing protein [Streptomyces sp. NPDC087440]|uniref:DUF397 domain-containing protein n=1 Tax=Streptomyces sp. NPDC087440 TaxID=3365790 RepID=UPI003803B7B7
MTNDALVWFKSSYSGGGANTECVEVAGTRNGASVRDSKVVEGPRISVNDASWSHFIGALRSNTL